MAEEQISVLINGLAHGGSFVGTVTEGPRAGQKAFIRDVVPGEAVEALIEKDKKTYLLARAVEVKSPSPVRQTPPCPLFGRCGGCDLQHMNIIAQREAKRAMIESMLAKQAKIPAPVTLMTGDLPELHYRNRVTLHVDRRGTLGFFDLSGRDVVAVHHCYISEGAINDTIAALQPYAERMRGWVDSIVVEVVDELVFVKLMLRPKVEAPEKNIAALRELFPALSVQQEDRILLKPDKELRPIGHFIQVNRSANEVLRRKVCEVTRGNSITDLFGGAGNLSMQLAARGAQIDLVELDPYLIGEAKALAAERGLEANFRFIAKSCEDFLKSELPRRTVVLDPPRSGAKDVVPYLSAHTTEEIIYVSCYPPTLCRDLTQLVSQGYELVDVFVLDMFPQTYHAETLSVLRLM